MYKHLLSAALLLGAAGFCNAGTICVSNTEESDSKYFSSFDNSEYYEVATLVSNSALTGSELTEVDFRIGDPDKVKSITLFLSLRLSTKFTPVYMQEIPVPADGNVAAVLEQPYKLNNASVYVGYKMECEAGSFPVSVLDKGGIPFSCFYRTSSSSAWEDGAEHLTLDMKVKFDGDFQENDIRISSAPQHFVLKGQESLYVMEVENLGCNPIDNISYKYSFGPLQGTKNLVFDTPVSGNFGSKRVIEIPVPASDTEGEYEATIEITAVNGDEVDRKGTFEYGVFRYFPVHRPLFEEYTGMWCGACVFGMASMEMMNDKYGEDFIAVSMHGENQDPLQILTSYPSNVATGFPVAWIDRTVITHPSGGDGDVGRVHGVEQVWQRVRDTFSPVALHLSAQWADKEQTEIKISSEVEFVKSKPDGADYRIGYVLVANGLTDSSWHQSNYVHGYDGDDPYFSKYGEMPEYIDNPVYDDVAILFPETKGVPGSLPSTLSTYTPYQHQSLMNISDAKSIYDVNLVQDKGELAVVAFVIDAGSNKVLNAVRCDISDYSGVSILTDADDEVVETLYFDFSGRRILNPQRGTLVLKKNVTARGNTGVEKLIF